MSNTEDTEDHLHTMRAMRDQAEAVCATGKHTQQDWDDLSHFRTEVLRLESALAGGDGAASLPSLASAARAVRK
jgi:hypothetical protein